MLGKLIRNIRAKDKSTRNFYALISASVFTFLIMVLVAPGYYDQSDEVSDEEAESVGFGSFFNRVKNEFSESMAANQTTPLEGSEVVSTTTTTTQLTESAVEAVEVDTTATTSSSTETTSKKPRTIRIATTTSTSSGEQVE